MLRKLLFPHSLIITVLAFLLIWILDAVRLNLHFLDPFNKGMKDYEITDIVYSKLRSHEVQLDNRIILVNTGKPDRDTLHKMLERIIAANPKVIAVDLLLSGRKDRRTDSLLQKSIRSFGNIVLGTRLGSYREDTRRFESEVDCDTFFCDHAQTGFTNFPANDTRTIRIFSPREMTDDGECLAFSTRTAKLYDPSAAETLLKRGKEVEEIYFRSNVDGYLQFEPSNILDSTIDLKKLMRDKIVLIGFLGSYTWDDPLLDRYFTPLNPQYTGRNIPDMYGLVLHANTIQMIIDKTYIYELPFWVNLLLTFIFCYINIHLLYKFYKRVNVSYHFVTRFIQIAEIVALFFIVALLFHFFRFKLDVALCITALLLSFDAIKFYDNFIRKRVPLLSKLPDVLPGKVIKKIVDQPKP